MRKEKACENWQLGEIKLKYGLVEEPKYTITSPQDAIKIVTDSIDLDELQIQESFYCIYMNNMQQVVGFRTISTGQLTSVEINVRLLLSIALILNAAKIIVMHNHPSGNLEPSNNDVKFTNDLIDIAEKIDLAVEDHIILVPGYFVSLRWKNYAYFRNNSNYKYTGNKLDGKYSYVAKPLKKRKNNVQKNTGLKSK
jgi:DNA repair protein RadC